MTSDSLFLELGVGYNTLGIIKYPFWRMALNNDSSRYATVSIGTADRPSGLEGRSVCIDADIRGVLSSLLHLRDELLVAPAPVLHGVEDGAEALPEGCERVLDPRRDLGVHLAHHQAVLLHAAELLRQHLLGDARDRLHELVEALCPREQVPDDQHHPLVAYQQERGLHRAGREVGYHSPRMHEPILLHSARGLRMSANWKSRAFGRSATAISIWNPTFPLLK